MDVANSSGAECEVQNSNTQLHRNQLKLDTRSKEWGQATLPTALTNLSYFSEAGPRKFCASKMELKLQPRNRYYLEIVETVVTGSGVLTSVVRGTFSIVISISLSTTALRSFVSL